MHVQELLKIKFWSGYAYFFTSFFVQFMQYPAIDFGSPLPASKKELAVETGYTRLLDHNVF